MYRRKNTLIGQMKTPKEQLYYNYETIGYTKIIGKEENEISPDFGIVRIYLNYSQVKDLMILNHPKSRDLIIIIFHI